jgi:hypothetical protein
MACFGSNVAFSLRHSRVGPEVAVRRGVEGTQNALKIVPAVVCAAAQIKLGVLAYDNGIRLDNGLVVEGYHR